MKEKKMLMKPRLNSKERTLEVYVLTLNGARNLVDMTPRKLTEEKEGSNH